ncbi:hypothetical protein K435DRAFT_856882 [Dendrothele bispora CBS 962.96]|uniref:Uncharacterized protein n=1 Tax=Dendrothele bispora (strain CBS 962.96) TaxID=1314807 RepID=A0A4S8M7E7_DENBC|nr:hypothetical protein K435DRAFT_856882 [Dendrothele bispora CBS 962.96]
MTRLMIQSHSRRGPHRDSPGKKDGQPNVCGCTHNAISTSSRGAAGRKRASSGEDAEEPLSSDVHSTSTQRTTDVVSPFYQFYSLERPQFDEISECDESSWTCANDENALRTDCLVSSLVKPSSGEILGSCSMGQVLIEKICTILPPRKTAVITEVAKSIRKDIIKQEKTKSRSAHGIGSEGRD